MLKEPKKKITVTDVKRYLPVSPPSFSPTLPSNIARYLKSQNFSNLSITEQNIIVDKYQTVYRNYYSVEEIVVYIYQFTQNKYTHGSIKRAVCNLAEKYGVVDWFKFLRKAMKGVDTSQQKEINKQATVNKIKNIFRAFRQKKKIWKGIEEVAQSKRTIDEKVLLQLCKESYNQVKQFIERNRIQCQEVLYNYQKMYPNRMNFVVLEKIINQGMDMYLDKKKVIYLYLKFDQINRGFFKTSDLLDHLLVVKKAKPIKKQTYYLTSLQELMERIRAQMNLLFYSAYQMEVDFDQFYQNKCKEQNINLSYEDQLDSEIFCSYLSSKFESRYSKYLILKVYQKIKFRANIHYLYNKPNLFQLGKLVANMVIKRQRKRILKRENYVFYSYRLIIMNIITKSKLGKLTRAQLTELVSDSQQPLLCKSFFCVWRVYPDVINAERIKKQCKLNQLACYLKLRKTTQQYDKMYEFLLELLPEDEIVTYEKLEDKINMNLDFVLDITRIKPLPCDRYQELNYRQAIKQIFQPEFQLDIRSYIHRKISEKAKALWKGYKARKQIKQRATKISAFMVSGAIDLQKQTISEPQKKLKTQKSKSSIKSKVPIINPETLKIVQQLLGSIIDGVGSKLTGHKKQFHRDQYHRQFLAVKKRQQYEYRTLTPRFSLHKILGVIGYGSDLMFLNKNKYQLIKTKYLYKPGTQIIDIMSHGNDIIILTSYFMLEFYSISQTSPYSYKTIELLDIVRNLTFTDLDSICSDRVYSKYPIFLRSTPKYLTVNTSMINSEILFISIKNNSARQKLVISQKEHILSFPSRKILSFINKSQKKSILFNQIYPLILKSQESAIFIYDIISEEIQALEQKKNVEICVNDVKVFIQNMCAFSPSLINCIIRQQLSLLKTQKYPEILAEVLTAITSHMYTNNLSLKQTFELIDHQCEGFIKIKTLKDYLFKIAQQTYIQNESQIDAILKNMTVGKNIEYETFCSILKTSGWKYAVWEKPYTVVRDFVYVEDCGLAIYTLDDDQNVYIKNVEDSVIIAILKGHNCTPSIHFVYQSYLLLTGDSKSIRLWRVYEDLIKKYDENPPWEIYPFKQIVDAHQDIITSIIYLPRAHHIVSTSLDSTAKFWKINPYGPQCYLQQVKRLYSNQCIFINSKSQNILLDNEGCHLETVALAKVSKQINENNKYKYQMKIEIYQVENIRIRTGPNNIYLQLPPKLKNYIQLYVESLGAKKALLLAKSIKSEQQETIKNNLITQNIEKGLFQSVKTCFIYAQFRQLENVCKYLGKRNICSQTVRILFQKYGIGIPTPNLQAKTNNKRQLDFLQPQQVQSNISNYIYISEEEFQIMSTKLKQFIKSKKQSFTREQIISFAGDFLNIVDYEKLQSNLLDFKEKSIDINQFLSLFRPMKLESELEKLYAILRSVNVLLRQEGKKHWNIFTSIKAELQKKKKVNMSQFEVFMKKLGLPEDKIKLLLSYLSRKKTVSLDDFVYYTKLAWQSVGFDMNQSNFSKVFMKNSRLLVSKLEKFKLDNDIPIEKPQFQDKAKNLQDSMMLSQKSSMMMSRKSSKKLLLKQSEIISQSHSEGQSNSQERRKSLSKSPSPNNRQDLNRSVPISSSNSRVSLSHSSQIKDQFTRQIAGIVKKINQMLRNENKTIWDITSVSVPEFMQNHLISETQFFSILNMIKSPIYLKDKLKIISYIMRESNQYTAIDLNILFELFEPVVQITRKNIKNQSVKTLPGQKYVISHLISRVNEENLNLQHCLTEYFFNQEEELSIQKILKILADPPFRMLNFCLKQTQQILNQQNKQTFNFQQLKAIIEERIVKFNIKLDHKEVTYIEEVIYQMEIKQAKVEQLFLKSSTQNGSVNFSIFCDMIKGYWKGGSYGVQLQNQYVKIVLYTQQVRNQEKQKDAPKVENRFNKNKLNKAAKPNKIQNQKDLLNKTIKYRQLINYIYKQIDKVKATSNSEKDAVKKFLKALQTKKINLLLFFASLDLNKNYYINEIQFVAGLTELKVFENFFPSIKKKHSKKLYYIELINYLVENQFVNYKCVDSQLEAAMNKFIRRFIRNDDIESVYDRLRAKQSNQPYNANFTSFQNALKLGNFFKAQQIIFLFSAFANAENLKSSKFSNDNIIKDQTNIHKTFNFKMFTDVITSYRNQTITKSPQYKLCSFFKKRGISLINQFTKWLQRNKKVKQIAEAIKEKSFTLSKDLYANFIKQLGTELQEKQIKELLTIFPNPLEFSNFNQKLQQIYKKGNSNLEQQETMAYLQIIYKGIKKLNVTIARLFSDFSPKKSQLDLNHFTDLVKFLDIGFTKIQIKSVFNGVDLEKKGFISLNQFENSLDEAAQNLDKEEDEYQLDYVIEKLCLSRDKYILKASRIAYNLQRAYIIFANVLSNQQISMLHKSALQHFKTSEITQKNMEQFIIEKQKESKAKKDKKYKDLILSFIKFLKRNNLDVTEAFNYFSKDAQVLSKNKFLLSYQSIGIKATILEINSLYEYLDENKIGSISLQRWQEKLNVIQYEKENIQAGISGEQLQVFYRVKLILSDVYLMFVRKLFKTKQIAAFFDRNNSGFITYEQFVESLSILGINLQQAMINKLLNYLDKQRNQMISVKYLVYEIENCLSSKTKLILETKTSCIFKEKIHLVQEKQNYFIEKLVKLQHFLMPRHSQYEPLQVHEPSHQKVQSCLLTTQFIEVIKDFGIVLGEDELRDVEKNFAFNKDNLKLYPLYFMFINIFKSFEYTLSPDQIERMRYQKLFHAIIKNGLTMKMFENLQSEREAFTFLSQLKIFTPIEVKLMIQSVLIQGTRLIDTQLLVRKARDSFLITGQLFKNTSMIDFGVDRKEMMKEWFKSQISEDKIITILKANSGKISRDHFETLLIKLQIILKKDDVQQLFAALGSGEDFLLIQQLLSTKSRQKQANALTSEEKGQQTVDVLLNHIAKSLDFKGVSLDQAWEKYYTNYGFITQQSFYIFLQELGFDYKEKKYEKTVQLLTHNYQKETKLNQYKVSQFQFMMKNRGHIPQKLSHTKKYFIQSQIVQSLSTAIQTSKEFLQNLQPFVQQSGQSINRITSSAIYSYIRASIRKSKNQIGQVNESSFFFYINLFIKQNQYKLSKLISIINSFLKTYFHQKYRRQGLKTIENDDESVLIKDMSNSSFNKASKAKLVDTLTFEQSILKICQQNFVQAYSKTIDKFDDLISSLQPPEQNNYRLALSLVIQKLLKNDYLLFLKPNLNSEENQHHLKEALLKNKISDYGLKFNLKIIPNLIIEKEELLADKGIYLINDTHYAMNVNEKKDFETFAQVSNLLDQKILFLRAKNYYLWQPNQFSMPHSAINYRWKFIPFVFHYLSEQILIVEENGYALPHLRWHHLNGKLGISRVSFPAHLDGNGRIHHISHENLIKPNDPYSAPQIFRKKHHTTSKVNSWILGCIMYEFIWGHSPNSFIQLLLEYIDSRQSGYELIQVLKMQQLPSDFRYNPFNYEKIKQILSFEHQLKGEGIPDDLQNNTIYFGLRGLLKTIQTLYGEQAMYYKKQFEIIQNMHELIVSCLDPNPLTRPTIKKIIQQLQQFVSQEDKREFNFEEYIEILMKHESTVQLNMKLIDPIKISLSTNDPSLIVDFSLAFKNKVVDIQKAQNINQIYCIPKKFPWPEASEMLDTYSRQVLARKQLIRSHERYSTICLLQNENYLQMLINLFVIYLNQQLDKALASQVYSNLMSSIFMIIEMLRDYSSPFCGYIGNILESFIQLYYKMPFCFTKDIIQQNSGSHSLMVQFFESKDDSKFLKSMKNVIYIDGSANVEYLPLYHYLLTHKQYQLLYEYFYCSLDLKKQPTQDFDRRTLAINYFRDRIDQQMFWQLFHYLKIDILVMKLMKNNDLTQNALMLFRDLTQSENILSFQLFHSNVFYLKIGSILNKSLIDIKEKSVVIQIATNLIRLGNKKIIKKMCDPAFSLIKQIFKLFVQPERQTPLHQQFILLMSVLERFEEAAKFCRIDIFSAIEGSETILYSFHTAKLKQAERMSEINKEQIQLKGQIGQKEQFGDTAKQPNQAPSKLYLSRKQKSGNGDL